MATTFCPRCGAGRVEVFRYCRSCQLDFDAIASEESTPRPPTALTDSGEPDTESDSPPAIPRIGLGLVVALAPIIVMFAATQLLNAGVLAQPGGAFMTAITPYFFASTLLIPIGLLIVGLALPTEGSPRPIVVGAVLAVGVPLLLFLWFIVAIAFSGAAGEPL